MTKNAQNESDWARKCVFMELQTIFEEFEVLTDEELMEVSGGTGVNGNHLYPYLLNEDQTNFLDLYNLDGSGR